MMEVGYLSILSLCSKVEGTIADTRRAPQDSSSTLFDLTLPLARMSKAAATFPTKPRNQPPIFRRDSASTSLLTTPILRF